MRFDNTYFGRSLLRLNDRIRTWRTSADEEINVPAPFPLSPPAQPISRKGALASALGVLAFLLAAADASAFQSLLGPPARSAVLQAHRIAPIAVSVWLLILVVGRRARPRAGGGAVVVLAGQVAITVAPVDHGGSMVMVAVISGWLAVELFRRHGLVLGVALPQGASRDGRDQAWYLFWRSGIIYAGSLLGMAVLLAVGQTTGLPALSPSGQTSALGIGHAPLGDLFSSLVLSNLWDGVVLTATVPGLLIAAGCPRWVIYAAVGALETLMQLYLGLPALALGVAAVVRTRLWLHYRRLTPIVLAQLGITSVMLGCAVTVSVLGLNDWQALLLRAVVIPTCFVLLNYARRRHIARGTPDTPTHVDTDPTAAA